MTSTRDGTKKQMRLRRDGTCSVCGAEIVAGTEAIYARGSRTVRCLPCEAGQADVEVGTGVAGASARREHERRRTKDEARLRARWGRLGGLAVALSDERPSTSSWSRGATGEERVGARLDTLVASGARVLHDRRIPGSRANIDHLVVTPAGVWVVDAKRYRGRPRLRVQGGILRARTEHLLVGSRDCSKLVVGVRRQVDLVRAVVGDVPVRGVLCFVDADWPLLGGEFDVRGLRILWPARLVTLLGSAQPAAPVFEVDAVHRALAAHFPPA